MRMFLKSWETCRVLAHGARTCICHTYGHRTLGVRGRLAPVRFWPLSACWLLCWSVAGGAGPGALERRNTGCILAPVRLAPVPFLPLSTCWLLCWRTGGRGSLLQSLHTLADCSGTANAGCRGH